jgi:hypothetical protein
MQSPDFVFLIVNPALNLSRDLIRNVTPLAETHRINGD